MSCDTIRAAIRAAGDGEWPREVAAHLASCDACVGAAIDRVLQQRPPSAVPVAFAADVARRARLEPLPAVRRSRGVVAGLAAAAIAVAVPAAWLGASGAVPAVLPIAALVCALAEGIALCAWIASTDVIRPDFRGPSGHS
jgi:anti-sigma factor RsiW